MGRTLMAAFALMTLGALAPGAAQAVVFDFDITFDGLSATQDASSDPITGTTLVPGTDGFNLDIHASDGFAWEVTAPTSLGIYAGFFVQDGGSRTANVTTTFFSNGVQVAQDVDIGTVQTAVHLGAQSFNLAAGLVFDQVVVDYTFLASTSTFTTIQPQPDIVAFTPFFRVSTIQFVPVSAPASLCLLALGLAAVRRRSRAVGSDQVIPLICLTKS